MMSRAENNKTLEERVAVLEAKIKELPTRTGGMLSSKDFKQFLIMREKYTNEPGEFDKQCDAFRKREWSKIGRKFIIDPYDELNLTPFSYDLSIGNEIFSVRKRDPMRERLPYNITPGETVIVLTKEFIALPRCYSATVWPRFNLVREGVFQSMVKIDPTWYGKLGVAMTNLSPRTIQLSEGMAFGTLILYELSSDTDVELQDPDQLQQVRVEIPDIPIRNTLQQSLIEHKLTNVCWVEEKSLVVRGLKKSSYETLRKIDGSKPWLETVEQAKKKWLESRHDDDSKRSIGMEALGMDDLKELVEGPPKGKPLEKNRIKEEGVSDDRLYDVAVEYGKPFDLIANIPAFIVEKIEKGFAPRLEAEVGAMFPQIVQLTLRVLALLSLIGVAVGLAAKYFDIKATWLGVVAVLTIPTMLLALVFIFGKFPQVHSEKERKIHSETPSISAENATIEELYHFPAFVRILLWVLTRMKK